MTEKTNERGINTSRDGDHSGHTALLVLSDEEGYVGDTITIKGRNLPAEEVFKLRWHSVDGEWGVLQAHEVVGPQYRPRTDTIGAVASDADGQFDREWTVPEDYGGSHRIELARKTGETVAMAEFAVVPHFELENTTAPLGGSFTLRGYGIGPEAMVNNYPVVWDNGYVGYVTGVRNRGTATAEIRAVGPVGDHVVQVWRSHLGIPFLQNDTQSPYGEVADGRRRIWTVEVTEPETPPQTTWVDDLPRERPIPTHYPPLDEDTEASIDISPQSGQADTVATVTGRDFPPHTEVELVWYRHDGHTPQGKNLPPDHTITTTHRRDVLPTVETDSDGTFEAEFEVPVDVGSTKPITAEVDGREVAVTGFMMQPSIEKFEPARGPAGTEIEIEIAGLGWTMYETTPMFVYDNDLLGYGCSLSGEEPTKLRTKLCATGQPGYHFLDVYPSIFKMEEDEPDFELMPHLSYPDNHPVRPVPGCHFAFEVTE